MTKYKFLLKLKFMHFELKEISELCKKNHDCYQLLKEKLDEVSSFIKCPSNSLNWDKYVSSNNQDKVILEIREIIERSLGSVEKYQANQILKGKKDHFEYSKELEMAVKCEIKDFEIKENSKVLFIGSGAMPITAFTIHNETSSRVNCLDIDEEAITLSSDLSKKWEMDSISFILSDIHDLDVSDFTHIIIASLVKEKVEIANLLLKKIKRNTKLILRYGNDLKSIFNYPLNLKEIKNCEKTVIKDRDFIYENLILERL